MTFISKDPAFAKLQKISTENTIYQSIYLVLEWDQETYMPPGAIEARANQIELLSGFVHKQKTSPSFKKTLGQLVDLTTGTPLSNKWSLQESACLRLWHKDWEKESKLPSSFVKECAKNSSASLAAWSQAKQQADFSLFAPYLEKTVALARKKAKLLGYKEHPYDALLDLYEPDMTVAKLTPLFQELKTALTEILSKTQKAKSQNIPALPGPFDPKIQMQIGKDLLQSLGFSEEISRLDVSSHPFCIGIHPQDTRMTTRIFPDLLISHILSVLHESGHGLYNTQLPQEYYGTPICEPVSYGIDESQSRLWETLIGRGIPFWKFFYPVLQKAFPEKLGSFPFLDFYRNLNTVKPSCIRVEADEVTYCLHIILRFEIEKALIEGSLKVKDVPSLWNKKMQELLGITPSHDGEGCLQDIHWAMGGFGYFPTYALGNLVAAQLFDTLKKLDPSLEAKIEQGSFSSIRNWLKDNIHKHGKIYTAEELIFQATKGPLQTSSYIQYLQKKYQDLYGYC
ncbi:MAG: carboxypeptidase M32 [Rhabdochlamydiaceae bacterium]|nr:carboxypeptidase M32 [Rhabdochlamydiaceae bacterium]